MAFFRDLVRRLLGLPDPRGGPPGASTDPGEVRPVGFHMTPGFAQWSPGPRQPVDRSGWKPCHGCGRPVPVVRDRASRGGAPVPGADQPTPDENEAVVAEGPDTWTYVCPFCGHCHVGTPGDSPDLRAQTACHDCGTDLGGAYQCPTCSFPRGWMTVGCPYCGNRQPVFAPHWVVHCDVFTLECVRCETVFHSLCIC